MSRGISVEGVVPGPEGDPLCPILVVVEEAGSRELSVFGNMEIVTAHRENGRSKSLITVG